MSKDLLGVILAWLLFVVFVGGPTYLVYEKYGLAEGGTVFAICGLLFDIQRRIALRS